MLKKFLFIGVVLVSPVLLLGCDYDKSSSSDVQSNSTPSDHDLGSDSSKAVSSLYKVYKDENLGKIKRSVEVELTERVSKEQLRNIAGQIHAEGFERTFISYRLDRHDKGAYWATTHYNPELEVKILGATTDQASDSKDIADLYDDPIGAWERSGPAHVWVAYRDKNSVYFDSRYKDGVSTTGPYKVKEISNGIKLNEPGIDDEYIIITSDGNAELWDTFDGDELTQTISPLKFWSI